MAGPRSKMGLSTQQLVPHVLQAIKDHSGYSLTVSDIYRQVDVYLIEQGETKFANSQVIRLAVNVLAGDHDTRVFRRQADEADGSQKIGSGGMPPWLYSDTEPVPRFSMEHREATINTLPPPRKNPDYLEAIANRTRNQHERVTQESGSDRAELIVTLVRQLAVDADRVIETDGYVSEIQKLTTLNSRLRTERDDAVRQLKAIARAQRTIQDMLGITQT